MASIVLMVNNKREFQVLNIMFQSYGYEVLALELSPESFLQVVQFKPHYILIELEENHQNVFEFIKNLQANIQMRRTPIILYGNDSDSVTLSKIKTQNGCTFIPRPLKTKAILDIVEPKKQVKLIKHTKEVTEYEGEVEYISLVMDPSTSAIQRIEIMAEKIGELLAFPFTIAKVLNVTQSESSGAKDLARAIEIDPVVVSSVLKVANSALYAKSNGRIITIKDAIVRLGFTETKNIAISLSVMNLFSDEERSIGFSREEFWFHSLATAIIAGKLAQRAHFSKPELAFICGLLHDFGIILLDEFFPAFLQTTLQSTMQKGVSFLDESKSRWGMTHNDVVMRLFDAWNLPEEVKFVIKSFHTYESYENEVNPALETVVKIVGVAQTIAKSISLGRECDEFVSIIPDEILKEIKIPVTLNNNFFDRVIAELNMFSNYLKLSRVFTFSRMPEEATRKVLFMNAARRIYNPFIYSLYASESQIIEKYELSQEEKKPDDIDLVILDIQRETRLEEITPFLHIPLKEEEIDEAENEEVVWVNDADRVEKFAPVLLWGQSEHIKSDDFPEHVTRFPEEIDLRVFSYAVESTILGNKVSFSDLFKRKRIVEEQPDKESETKEEKSLHFKTRIINKKIIILEFFEEITHAMLPNFKNILALAIKRSHYVALDLTHATSIDTTVFSLVKMIKTKFEKRGVILVPCTISENPEEQNVTGEDSLLQFRDDKAVYQYVYERIRNTL